MKKIFSTLLILTMVLTSLSVGVSASFDETNKIFTFDGTTNKGFNVGELRLSNADGTVTKTLGTITDDVEIMGMKNVKKLLFEGDTLTGATASTLSIRGEVHYKAEKYNFDYSQGHCGNEYFTIANMNTILKALDRTGDGVADKNSSKVVKYTMYAYSGLPDGEPISFNIVRSAEDIGAILNVPASKLYSENDIPHKIDFIVYQTNKLPNPVSKGADSSLRMEIWIDGLPYAEDLKPITDGPAKEDKFVFLSPNVNITPDESGNVTWKDSELYMWTYMPRSNGKPQPLTDTEVGGKYITVHTRDDLHSQFFQNVDYFGTSGSIRNGFVTGVNSALVSDIETAYTTALESGDRVIEVDRSFYNDPASIWNDEASESSVSLIKISDGTVYGVANKANVTGTFEDYLISINGVYTKVVEKPFVTDYDIASKTATVKVSDLPEDTESLQIIVAAYNANKTLANIKASKVYTGAELESNFTYTISDTFPTNASEYKVFYFDSLTSAKPLMRALEK